MTCPGTLYLVPVPIGEGPLEAVIPEDVRKTVTGLTVFIAERPKTARAHLKLYGITAPLNELEILPLSSDTPETTIQDYLQRAQNGMDIGLLSEAGCPAVADPGALVVRKAHAQDIPVRPLVGPSSILLALMASGMSGQRFTFHGYLPVETDARIKKIRSLEIESENRQETQIFIETPYRNLQLLQALIDQCQPDTLIGIATDLTSPSELIQVLPAANWQTLPEINRRPTIFMLFRLSSKLARKH